VVELKWDVKTNRESGEIGETPELRKRRDKRHGLINGTLKKVMK